MLLAWYPAAAVAALAVVATIAVWLWPPRRPDEELGVTG
jgi:cytochrome c oxidase subunit I+III